MCHGEYPRDVQDLIGLCAPGASVKLVASLIDFKYDILTLKFVTHEIRITEVNLFKRFINK